MTVWGNSGTEPPLCPTRRRLNGALGHKGALTMGRTLVFRASPSALSLSHSPGAGAGGMLASRVEAGGGAGLRLKRSQPPGAPLGTLPRRQGRETRPGPPNLPRAKKGFPNGKNQGDWEGWGRRGCGRPGPFLPTGLWKEARGQPDPTHFGPQFSHLF